MTGVALLLCFQANADESLRRMIHGQLRGDSYVLVEDSISIRLYVLSDTVDAAPPKQAPQPPPGSVDAALAMTLSADRRVRVRGLTLLAGVEDATARDAALMLINDPVEAVREEAYVLLLEHPDADHASIVKLGSRDPSLRVRDAVADAVDDDNGD